MKNQIKYAKAKLIQLSGLYFTNRLLEQNRLDHIKAIKEALIYMNSKN